MTDLDLDLEEVARRLPTLELIDSHRVRRETAEIASRAPRYFWTIPASTSGYHHPACRGERGLWVHTLMLSTVIDRLADSYVGRGLLEEREIDLAHSAAILHDMRKAGIPPVTSSKSTSDHDLVMADVVRESELPQPVADAIASHMGAWYDGPEPSSELERLVHDADMIASTSTITPAIQGPIPSELDHVLDHGIEEVDLR